LLLTFVKEILAEEREIGGGQQQQQQNRNTVIQGQMFLANFNRGSLN